MHMTQQSCHVQNYMAKTTLQLGWKHNEFSNMNSDEKFVRQMGCIPFHAWSYIIYIYIYIYIWTFHYFDCLTAGDRIFMIISKHSGTLHTYCPNQHFGTSNMYKKTMMVVCGLISFLCLGNSNKHRCIIIDFFTNINKSNSWEASYIII